MVRDDVSIDKKKREKIKFFHSYYSANIGNSVSLDSKDDMSPWPRSRPLRKFVQKKKKKKKVKNHSLSLALTGQAGDQVPPNPFL